VGWLVVGTVPQAHWGFAYGPCQVHGDVVVVDGRSVPVARGTPALVGAATVAAQTLGIAPPHALLAGDIGSGDGSRAAYAYLLDIMPQLPFPGITFHYLMPDVAWHNKLLWAAQERSPRPILVADAGFMYAAKMSGFASQWDLFTPDVGEMAFLADEVAPHPFYTRGFLLHEEDRVGELIPRAYAGGNAARFLLVKGRTDLVVEQGQVLGQVASPQVPAMEPIGGTGDTLTGMVTAFLAAGYPMADACLRAALANRWLGALARPTPAWGVAQLVSFIPAAVRQVLEHPAAVEPESAAGRSGA